MLRRTAVAFGCWFVLGCASSKPLAESAEPVASIAGPGLVNAPAKPASELRRFWPFAGELEVAVYADMDGLLRTQQLQLLLPTLLKETEQTVPPKQRECALALSAGVKEVAMGSVHEQGLLLLGIRDESLGDVRKACLGTVVPANKIEFASASEAYQLDDTDVMVVDHDVVLMGSRNLVEAALKAPKPAAWPNGFVLAPGQCLFARVELPEQGISGQGSLTLSAQLFRLQVVASAPNEEMARGAESAAQSQLKRMRGLTKNPGSPDAQAMAKLLDAISIQRQGKQLSGMFELHGSAEEQASLLGTTLALGVFGARKYILNAKTAEARNSIGQIAMSYARTAPKKFVSLPPVPAMVQHGTKYQSSPNDWKPWSAIAFSLTDPQYFQYEVVAAKDGKSAEVIARGDLNGDGKQSSFSLKLTLDPKTKAVSLADSIVEQDPAE